MDDLWHANCYWIFGYICQTRARDANQHAMDVAGESWRVVARRRNREKAFMLHRTVFVLLMSMLFGAMAALAMSAETLCLPDIAGVVDDVNDATPIPSTHVRKKKRAVDPSLHWMPSGRLVRTTYPAR